MAAGALLVLGLWDSRAEEQATADYAAVHAIFEKHCLDCHAAQEPEAKLVLESFETLMKGGESGPALVAGKSGESLLVKMVEGSTERDGKRLIMPPGKPSSSPQLTSLPSEAGSTQGRVRLLQGRLLPANSRFPRFRPKRRRGVLSKRWRTRTVLD